MANMNGYDANKYEPQSDFEPLQPGWYQCVIIESEWKETKNGRGEYLQIVLEVDSGPRKGAKLWERLNLKNDNQVAVDIANETLSSICRSVGVMTPQDSQELHYRPLLVKTKLREWNGNTNAEPCGYKAVEQQQAAPARQRVSQPVPDQQEAASPPWKQ